MSLDWFMDALAFLPAPVVVFLLAMIPFGELRISIPVGIFIFDMDPWLAFAISIPGNLLPVPVILVFFRRVEAWLRRWPLFDRIFDRLFDRTIRRSRQRVHTYEEIALMLFVALPAPFTGAWTGSLIAVLFDLERSKSFVVIALGVLMAGVIVTVLCLMLGNFVGV